MEKKEEKEESEVPQETEKKNKKSRFGFISKPFVWFKKTRRRNKVIVIVLLIVSFFIISNRIQAAQKKPDYTLAKATRTDITEIVTETGTIASNSRTDIFSPTNGIIENVFVKNGDQVTTGQELFTIKSSATEQEQSQARANYLAAQNTLDTANATALSLQSGMFGKWDTYKGLAESDAYENPDGSPKYDSRAAAEYHVAEKDWQAAEANYKKQQLVISQAQAAVSAAYLAYLATQNATVKSTADGVVSNVSVSMGSTVKATTPTAPATPLALISNDAVVEVIVSLSENDISKVKEGQKVGLTINSIKDKEYEGIVSRVDSIGTDDNGVTKYNVYIRIISPDENLRQGMTADAEITTKQLGNVLSVPNSAVKPHEGGKAVRVIDKKGEVKFIPVKIGVKGESRTQILSGIKEGQEVVTSLSNEKIKKSGSLF